MSVSVSVSAVTEAVAEVSCECVTRRQTKAVKRDNVGRSDGEMGSALVLWLATVGSSSDFEADQALGVEGRGPDGCRRQGLSGTTIPEPTS